MFITVPAVHSHFRQHGSLHWEKLSCCSVCRHSSCHGSEETLLPFSLVSIEDLLPHDTGSKWIQTAHCFHNCNGSVCDIQQNPWTTPTTGWQLRFLETMNYFHLLICRFFFCHMRTSFPPSPPPQHHLISLNIASATASLQMMCYHTLW